MKAHYSRAFSTLWSLWLSGCISAQIKDSYGVCSCFGPVWLCSKKEEGLAPERVYPLRIYIHWYMPLMWWLLTLCTHLKAESCAVTCCPCYCSYSTSNAPPPPQHPPVGSESKLPLKLSSSLPTPCCAERSVSLWRVMRSEPRRYISTLT